MQLIGIKLDPWLAAPLRDESDFRQFNSLAELDMLVRRDEHCALVINIERTAERYQVPGLVRKRGFSKPIIGVCDLPASLERGVEEEASFLAAGGDRLLRGPSYQLVIESAKALLRRAALVPRMVSDKLIVLRKGAVRIDVDRYEVRCGETVVRLSRSECEIITCLARRPGVYRSRQELLDALSRGNIEERTIDSHVKNMRRKFEPLGYNFFDTKYGLGYALLDT